MSGPYRVAREVLGFPQGAIIDRDECGVAWLAVPIPHLDEALTEALADRGILTRLPARHLPQVRTSQPSESHPSHLRLAGQ